MPVHRIRLRGPWDVRPHADGMPGRMTVPGTLRDGGWPGFAGRVSFYRRFGRPSNVSPTETIWLVFEKVVGRASLRFGDVHLGEVTDTAQFEVTARLAERNVLEVVVDATDDECGIVGEVVLEIRSDPGSD